MTAMEAEGYDPSRYVFKGVPEETKDTTGMTNSVLKRLEKVSNDQISS